MYTILQALLAPVAIAFSVFSLITYLWLGLTVLLIGDRRSLVTWVGGSGLLLGALFFLSHGALVGAGVPAGATASDVWWHISWVPAFGAPICWAAIGLHYAGLAGAWKRLRVIVIGGVAAVGALTALLALVCWPAIANYGDFIRLLDASLHFRRPEPSSLASSPLLPALGLAFVIYIALCASLPWISLVARRLLPAEATQSGTHVADAVLLWDAWDAWSRARRALLAASLCMLGAGAVVAVIGTLILVAEHRADLLPATTPLSLDLDVPATPPGHVPTLLVLADLIVQAALAGLGLLVGWAVVRQGILVERRLPQRGYLSHWQGMALVAGILAAVVAWMAALLPEALPDLLLLVTLVTAASTLFTWQSYVAHDTLLRQLRPFVVSLAVGHTGWLSADPRDVERNVEALFTSLCRDVLGAARGHLSLTAGRLHRTYVYNAPDETATDPRDTREWALPVSDERGVVARLVLGPRVDGAGYTSGDLEVARACGQRILDAVGEFAAAQAVASLARRRGLETELSAALPRRVLHDEVLPRLHLAMLRLEALRARLPLMAVASVGSPTPAGEDAVPEDNLRDELGEVVGELGHAHHDLAALMRAAPTANMRHLEHGLVSALRAALDGEFRGTFDELDWEAGPEACAAADALPTITADLLLGATMEAIRNAGRHARGGDLHRHLTLHISLAADDQWVSVSVADDGVGLQSERMRDGRVFPESADDGGSPFTTEPNDTAGTRSGLLTHGALVALVGGALTVHSQPGDGTQVAIRVPRTQRDNTSPRIPRVSETPSRREHATTER
jgi:signal transduction histidine kinase